MILEWLGRCIIVALFIIILIELNVFTSISRIVIITILFIILFLWAVKEFHIGIEEKI